MRRVDKLNLLWDFEVITAVRARNRGQKISLANLLFPNSLSGVFGINLNGIMDIGHASCFPYFVFGIGRFLQQRLAS